MRSPCVLRAHSPRRSPLSRASSWLVLLSLHHSSLVVKETAAAGPSPAVMGSVMGLVMGCRNVLGPQVVAVGRGLRDLASPRVEDMVRGLIARSFAAYRG